MVGKEKMKVVQGRKGKLFVVALIVLLVVAISACSLPGRRSPDGPYYVGSEGVTTYLDRPPRLLPYYSGDIAKYDGNMVELNVRAINRGASDSYGAVFLTGFESNLFTVYISDEYGVRPVSRVHGTEYCRFDFFGIGARFPSFRVYCGGIGVQSNPMGTGTISLNFDEISRAFGWNLPSGVRVYLTGGGSDGYGISVDMGGRGGMELLLHGKILMSIASRLNFHDWGGSIFMLRGHNPESLVGGEAYTTFLVQATGLWPAGKDYVDFPYSIKTCYAYTTFVSPSVCIDSKPYEDVQKNCRAEQSIPMSTQGAPVAVTNVYQINTGNEVILEFTVKNVGRGIVWDVGYLERCSPHFPDTTRPTMQNVVYVGFAELDGQPLQCDRYVLRLDPHTRSQKFQCRYDIRGAAISGGGYIAPLRMELWYGYEETINNQLRVRRYN